MILLIVYIIGFFVTMVFTGFCCENHGTDVTLADWAAIIFWPAVLAVFLVIAIIELIIGGPFALGRLAAKFWKKP